MASLAQIRQQTNGAYDDLSDEQLADGIYRKFYADMPREDFNRRIGLQSEAPAGTPVPQTRDQAQAAPGWDAAQPDMDAAASPVDALPPGHSDIVNAGVQGLGQTVGRAIQGVPAIAAEMDRLGGPIMPASVRALTAQDPDFRKSGLYRAGGAVADWADQTFPVEQETLGTGMARAGAKILLYLGAGALGGPAAVAALGGGEGAGSGANDATQHGASPAQATSAAGSDALIGIASAAPVETVLSPLLRASPGLYQTAKAALLNALRSGAIGATVGAAQQYATNLVAHYTYDPQRDPLRGVEQAGEIGGATFGALGAARGATAPPGVVVDPNAPMTPHPNTGAPLTPPGGPATPRGGAGLDTSGAAGAGPVIDATAAEVPPGSPVANSGPVPQIMPPRPTSAFQPQSGQPVRVVYPDGTAAFGTYHLQPGGETEAIAFDNSEVNPESVRGKTIESPAGTAQRYVTLEPDDRAPAPPSPPPPKPTLKQIMDDPRGVDEIRAEQQELARAAATPPEPAPPSTLGTKENPVQIKTVADLHAMAAEVDQAPTDGQKDAGNYAKGHGIWEPVPGVRFEISIENPQGSVRSGVGPDGKPWSVAMPGHYGYVLGTKGMDGENIDVTFGGAPMSPTVYVVDQKDPDSNEPDEHKVMAGFASQQQAIAAYSKSFSDGSGPLRIGAVTKMTVQQLRDWMDNGDTGKPLAYQPPVSAAPPAGASSGAAQPGQPPAGTAQAAPPAASPERLQQIVGMMQSERLPLHDQAHAKAFMANLGIGEIEFRQAYDLIVGQVRAVEQRAIDLDKQTDAAVKQVADSVKGKGQNGQAAAQPVGTPGAGHKAAPKGPRAARARPADAAVAPAGGNDAGPSEQNPAVRQPERPVAEAVKRPGQRPSVVGELAAAISSPSNEAAKSNNLPKETASLPHSKPVEKPEAASQLEQTTASAVKPVRYLRVASSNPEPVPRKPSIVVPAPTRTAEQLRKEGLEGSAIRMLPAKAQRSLATDARSGALTKLEDVRAEAQRRFPELEAWRKTVDEAAAQEATAKNARSGPRRKAAVEGFIAGAKGESAHLGVPSGRALESLYLSAHRQGDVWVTDHPPPAPIRFELERASGGVTRYELPPDPAMVEAFAKRISGKPARTFLREGGDDEAPEEFIDETAEAKQALGKRRDHTRMRSYLLGRGKADGQEHVVAIDGAGEIVSAGTSGEDDVVGLGDKIVPLLYQPEAKIDLRHNHPASTSLSTEDVMILGYVGADRVVAYGHNGGVFDASLAGSMRRKLDALYGQDSHARADALKIIAKAAYDAAFKSLVASARASEIPAATGDLLHTHAVNVALGRAGVLDYKGRFADIEGADLPAIRQAVRSAEAAARRALKEAGEPNAVPDQSTEPLPAKGEARGVPGEDEAASPGRSSGEVGDTDGDGKPRTPEPKEGQSPQVGSRLPPSLREDTLPADAEPHPIDKRIKAAREFLDRVVNDLQMETTPMAARSATDTARVVASDWANADRLARHRYITLDEKIEKAFTPERRAAMGAALERQGVLALGGHDAGPDEGLNALPPAERAMVEKLNTASQALWWRGVAAGLVEGEGLPYYFPRMAAEFLGDGEYGRVGASGQAQGIDALGRNFTNTSANLKHRKYATPEETEGALKKKFGAHAGLVKDIRVLPLALYRFERAIAGRELINSIKELGERSGQELVADGERPEFFTIDHPAFRTARPRFRTDEETGKTVALEDENGDVVLDHVPIFVHRTFEGPLRAILTRRPGALYRALLQIKSRSTGLIMYSPMIHLMVELGRALPAMPFKVLTLQAFRDGGRLIAQDGVLDYAIEHGLVYLGDRRGITHDVSDIAEAPNIRPGRGLLAKGVRVAIQPFNISLADRAARGIDIFGDFYHHVLLWKQIGKLQMGIWGAIRKEALKDGIPEAAAARIASHIANRFAGALPPEAMSEYMRRFANVVMFSRTFTIGNIAAMKDVITGLPKNTAAQVTRDITAAGSGAPPKKPPPPGLPGAAAAPPPGRRDGDAAEAVGRITGRYARRFAARRALGIVLLDIALSYLLQSFIQTAFDHWGERQEGWDEIERGYWRRLQKTGAKIAANSLNVLMPFELLAGLTPMSENEPGKQDHIYIGRGADGRGLYLTNPLGRIGAEFAGWMTSPLDMVRRKMSTIVRPAMDVLRNDAGFNRQIYDPDAAGFAGAMQDAGAVFWHLAQAQLPWRNIQDAAGVASGDANPETIVATILPFVTGMSLSTGAPGGPEAGDVAHQEAQQFQAIRAAIPAAAKLVQGGDSGTAYQKLLDAGMEPKQANEMVNHLAAPAGVTTAKLNRFNRTATDDERERLEEHLNEAR